MFTLIRQDFAPAAAGVGEPASCSDAVRVMRWPWQGELLFSVENKLFGAKRGFKPLYERIKSLCPGFHSRCLRFLFWFGFFSIFLGCSLFPLKHVKL